MVFSNKKGMQVAINFLVMLIMGIAIFSGGILLVTKMMNNGQGELDKMDAQTEVALERALDVGQKFAFLNPNKEIQSGKATTFSYIINNDQTEVVELTMKISIKKGYDAKGNIIPDSILKLFGCGTSDIVCGSDESNVQYTDEIKIKSGAKKTGKVIIDVPKKIPKGEYIFNVELDYTKDNTEFARLNKLYLKITN